MLGDRRPFPIVLVVPNFDTLRAWAKTQGIATDPESMVADPRVVRSWIAPGRAVRAA
jgi:long-chain acyl-CoA synthetase